MSAPEENTIYDEEYLRRAHYSDTTLAALRFAEAEAQRRGDRELDARSVLLGVLSDKDGVVAQMVRQMGESLERLDTAIRALPGTPHDTPKLDDENGDVTQRVVYLAPEVQKVFQLATDEAMRTYSFPRYVGSEHLLLGIIRVDTVEIGTIMRQANISLERARAARDIVLGLPHIR